MKIQGDPRAFRSTGEMNHPQMPTYVPMHQQMHLHPQKPETGFLRMDLWVSSSVLADRTAPLHLSEASFLKTKQESASPLPRRELAPEGVATPKVLRSVNGHPPPNGGGPRRGFLRMESTLISGTIAVMRDGIRASRVIERSLAEHPHWSGEMKGRFSDALYDIVRRWRLLWHELAAEPGYSMKGLTRLIEVHRKYEKERLDERTGGGISTGENAERLSGTNNMVRAVAESVPDWLDDVGEKELGSRWDGTIRTLNERPRLSIRVNTLRTDIETVKRALEGRGITCERVEWAPDALVLGDHADVFSLPEFHSGLLEVQDPSSQLVARLLDPRPGEHVVDACAGQGGKSLHLSALMNNRGRIVALDTVEWKLAELRRRARRGGCHNLRTRLVASTKDHKRLKGKADRVLLDVPCSGLGRLRRSPDIRWKLSADDLERLRELQAGILDRYCTLPRPGGRLVYASCSVLPSEGEGRISRFLREHQDEFTLVEERRVRPDESGFDGFYIGILERR